MPDAVTTPVTAPVTTPVVPAVTTPVVTPPAIAAVVPPATPVVPAAVEYKFDAVDGVAPEFDTSITATAKAMGWDLETAKKFRAHEIDLAKAEQASDAKAQADRASAETQRIAQEDAAWEKSNREHAEHGGAKYDETTTRIEKLLAEYDKTGAFAKQLAAVPRIKNEPAFRAFLANLAYAHGDAKFVQGGTQTGKASQSASLGEMYPSMK